MCFHLFSEENIRIDAATGRQLSGHVDPGTAATFQRKIKETSNKVGDMSSLIIYL